MTDKEYERQLEKIRSAKQDADTETVLAMLVALLVVSIFLGGM